MVIDAINVQFQGQHAASVSFDRDKGYSAFEYTKEFIDSGIELSPLRMPLSKEIFQFPYLNYETFLGLPGLIADSLPDDFGNAVLNEWVASRGGQPDLITPLERLQYMGMRGMGALEYVPAKSHRNLNASREVEIQSLVAIAQEVLNNRSGFTVDLTNKGYEDKEAMMALLSVGMSAGGARPKAVLAFNKDFTSVRSGQVDVPEGYEHYLVKFDGVSEHNTDRETFGDPLGFSAMEYTYYLMARKAGITMMPSFLLEEGSRRHFVTKRFDRQGNRKRHIQTLTGIAHVDYKQPGSFSYAELFGVARQLRLPAEDAEQIMRLMIFNIIARNHDDHAKNFAFMMDDKHRWRLAPAYDVAYSYKPGSKWVNSHWMSLNGKRDDFTREDIYTIESISPLFHRKKLDALIDEISEAVFRWPDLARENGVPQGFSTVVRGNLRKL